MRKNMLKAHGKGFSLIELMVVIGIVSVLTLIALPNYRNFILKAEFIETKMAIGAVKVSLEVCVQTLGLIGAGSCVHNSHGIPVNKDPGEGTVGIQLVEPTLGEDEVVTADDVFTIIATAPTDSKNKDATFTLAGSFKSGGRIVWDEGQCSKPELC